MPILNPSQCVLLLCHFRLAMHQRSHLAHDYLKLRKFKERFPQNQNYRMQDNFISKNNATSILAKGMYIWVKLERLGIDPEETLLNCFRYSILSQEQVSLKFINIRYLAASTELLKSWWVNVFHMCLTVEPSSY